MSGPVTQIGKYHIIEQVGEGAMGVVYKATDPVLNRTVAIKVMSEGLAQDAALRERFLREAQAAGSLQHPNVVTVYDFGETDGHLFIAMEFIQGTDLEHLMSTEKQLSLARKLDIIIDVLNGLSYAHRRGIVHRDIKPANVRVDEEGRARIMDFGVARLSTSNLTGTGMMMGTPNYMAPEQITGGELTASADLFSVGAMLYELLTKAKPFAADTLHRVLFKIVSDAPPEMNTLTPGLPSPLADIVKKSLAKEPADRYRNATEMANALSAVRSTLGVPRASKTVSQRGSIELAFAARDALAQSAAKRRRWQKAGGGVAALLVVGILGVFILNRERPASSLAPVTKTQSAPPTAAPDSAAERRAAAVPQNTPPPSVGAGTEVARAPSKSTKASDIPRAPAPPVPSRQVGRATDSKSVVADSPTSRIRAQDTARPGANAPSQTTTAVQNAPVPQPAPVVPQPPVQQAPTPAVQVPAPAPENPAPAIAAVIAEYAQAIGTRDVAEVRRSYPGMTPQQQSAWESFFSSVRSIKATLAISALDVKGSTAVARLTGMYEYITRAGRTEQRPASFDATLERDGDRWKLRTVR